MQPETKSCIECGRRWKLHFFEPDAPGDFAHMCASCREAEAVKVLAYLHWLATKRRAA